MSSQSCATCRFWVQLSRDAQPNCHRYPPMRAVLDGPHVGRLAMNETAAGLTQVVFRAPTLADTWCGEWEQRQ